MSIAHLVRAGAGQIYSGLSLNALLKDIDKKS